MRGSVRESRRVACVDERSSQTCCALIVRPFEVGDVISAGGTLGTVKITAGNRLFVRSEDQRDQG
jgi:hypothetical protein